MNWKRQCLIYLSFVSIVIWGFDLKYPVSLIAFPLSWIALGFGEIYSWGDQHNEKWAKLPIWSQCLIFLKALFFGPMAHSKLISKLS